MKIKIKENAAATHYGMYRRTLEMFQGKWLEVDTTHLFTNQFNVLRRPGIAPGVRISEADVELIENDERIGRSRCKLCNRVFFTGDNCPLCKEDEKRYKEELIPGSSTQLGLQESMSRSLKKCFANKEIEF